MQPAPSLPLLSARSLPSSALAFIWYVARGRFKRWLLLMLACESIHASCGILLPYGLSKIISSVTSQHIARESALRVLFWPLCLFVGLCCGELIFGRVNAGLQLRLGPRQRQYVSRSLFDYLHRHSHRFLTEHFAGALAHRISETSHGVNTVLWAVITELWPIAIVITVANLLLFDANPWLGSFTGAWSVGFIGCSLVLARRTQPLAHAASNARSHTVGMIVDSVSNHASVRLFARLNHERERLDLAYEDELRTVLVANHAMERVRMFQFSASTLLKAGTVIVAVTLWSRGSIDVGQFVMATSLALLIIAEVRNLSRRFLELFESLGNVASGVRAILRAHELVDLPDAADHCIERGAIEFDRVDFCYADGAQVFRRLSVSIAAGERVGLVGLSGSGKSTFVSLLLRLFDPQSGCIRIDGHDLRAFTQASLHGQIGLIPQDPTLFHRSLRENIRYGDVAASDSDVEHAAAHAHAAEFIARIPEAYDAQVGERGVKLSGGQRQRIAIARVILKNAPVLILDEATSSLDSITERAIQSALDDVMLDKTVLVIAHRLSTIAHLDRILVFSEGEIVEDGTHAQLLARRGAYYDLWSRQTGGLLASELQPEAAAE